MDTFAGSKIRTHYEAKMKISLDWLRDYVDVPSGMGADEVAAALTSVGLEVDGVERVEQIAGGLTGVVVGEVVSCEPHPQSDHMSVCRVRVKPEGGDSQGESNEEGLLQVVCGASNVGAGQRVVVATVGARLPDGEGGTVAIKRCKLRGIESQGMICAEDEIGLGKDHSGIIVLPHDTPLGMEAAELYKVQSDWVIDIDITPNRADACSHYGVARDLYAWLLANGHETSLHRPSCEAFHVDDHERPIQVRVEQPTACPRYAAVSLTGCDIKESPEWLKRRLTAVGLRPINNVVDITNYVMMAYGQPLHCFDADMVEGDEVVVRSMAEGTSMVTLDGVEHSLGERDLVIANGKGEPMCIAGVMGGRGSGTYPTTRDVVLESAYFHPTWIRKSARRHGMQTDASFRFERGVDPNGQVYALMQAAIMARELAGARVSMEVVDVVSYEELGKPFEVFLPYAYADSLIGKQIPRGEMKTILESLEMRVTEATEEGLHLSVPPYRVDVRRPCDVVEDLLRIYGYNRVELPEGVTMSLSVEGETDRSQHAERLICQQLTGAGWHEIMNNSLQRVAYYEGLTTYPEERCVRLMNPLSQDLGVMRQTLLFGGLETIARNTAHKAPDLRLYEVGNCYHYDSSRRCPSIVKGESQSTDPEVIKHVLDAYSEEHHLALWLTGKRVWGSWAHPDEDSSPHELLATVMNILARLGVPTEGLTTTQRDGDDIYERSLLLTNKGGKTVAEIGIVGRSILSKFDIEAPVYYADLSWGQLMRMTRNHKVAYHELDRFPSVRRDLALLVDKRTEFAQIELIARETERRLLREVSLFDVYEGRGIPEGKRSYAVSFTLQDTERTLTDKAVDAVMGRIVKNLTERLGAELR